jgi:hypothetical protein
MRISNCRQQEKSRRYEKFTGLWRKRHHVTVPGKRRISYTQLHDEHPHIEPVIKAGRA